MESEALVSRAGTKLALAAQKLGIDFKDRVVLDVGASTGGFTEFAIKQGATKVYAVEKGTGQLHISLSKDPRVVALEKTDIRQANLPERADLAMVDVSFISVRSVLDSIVGLTKPKAPLVVLFKPQFEAKVMYPQALHQGVIKNKTWRRKIIKDFEDWLKDKFLIQNKLDAELAGAKGNLEKFYVLEAKSKD